MTSKLTYETLADETGGGAVALIRFDDAPTMNALSPEMGQALRDSLQRAGQEARCIVIAGSERAFCSGANLAGRGDTGEMRDPGATIDAGEHLRNVFNPMMQTMRDSPIPIVTAIRGAAAGIGASIAIAGDIIVAGETAYFLQAFRRIGLVPDGGSPYLLLQSVGRVRAMELMLLGEKLPAKQALDWGLVTRVVADDAVEQTAMTLARNLANGPTRALGMIRRATWAAAETSWSEQLALESRLQSVAGHTADFAEGVAAFFEKRKAVFIGK